MKRVAHYFLGLMAVISGLVISGLIMAPRETMANPLSSENPGDLPPNRFEPSFLPALGGNTDLGFIFGAFGVLAKFKAGYAPYRWRGEFVAVTSVKNDPQGTRFPMYAFIAKLDFPELADGKLRVLPSISFTQTINAGYYGIGNASSAAVPSVVADAQRIRYNQYVSGKLQGFAEFRYALLRQVGIIGGLGAHHTQIEFYKNSRLLVQRDAPTATCAPLMGASTHPGIKLALGAHWDTRDHETATTRGMYHALNVRYSPGPLVGTNYQFAGVSSHLRFYLPLLGGRLVSAMRVLGDVIVGDAPFYELRNMNAFDVIDFSGMNGIRGLPEGRFRGKVKILANFELRYMPIAVAIKKQRFKIGLAAFVDTGRVWADLKRCPALDGNGMRPKIGAGGGPRIQWGETLIMRFDFAHSPNTSDAAGASPLAFYMDMKQIF